MECIRKLMCYIFLWWWVYVSLCGMEKLMGAKVRVLEYLLLCFFLIFGWKLVWLVVIGLSTSVKYANFLTGFVYTEPLMIICCRMPGLKWLFSWTLQIFRNCHLKQVKHIHFENCACNVWEPSRFKLENTSQEVWFIYIEELHTDQQSK